MADHGSTQRHFSSTRGGPKEETDAQVAQIRNDPRPPSLCDRVTEELLAGRHPDRPLLSRIAVVGEIASRESEPVRNAIENAIGVATKRVNAEDPSGGLIRTKVVQQQPPATEGGAPTSTTTIQTGTVTITGVCVEYQSSFVAVFESEPYHLVELVRELKGKLAKQKPVDTTVKGKSGSVDITQVVAAAAAASSSGGAGSSSAAAAGAKNPTSFSNIHIIYQVDDIITRSTNIWSHIDVSSLDAKAANGGVAPASNAAAGGAAAASNNNNNNAVLYSAVPLNDQIIKAVYNLIALGVHAQGLPSKAMREHFSTGAATTHPKLLPPTGFIIGCIKSDLCLSAAEYLQVFSLLPNVDRSKELLNPLEPPLHY